MVTRRPTAYIVSAITLVTCASRWSPARRPVGAATSSRAPRGDRPPGRTPRASACGCIEHSAERRPQGAALNKYGNSNHTGGPWLTNTTSQGAVGR